MTKSAKLNTDILRLAILIFSFCMLCLGLEKGGDIVIWNWGRKLSFPAPIPLYQVLGWISLALVALLVVAAFSKCVRDKLRLEDIMRDDTETDNGTIAVARYGKWLIIFLVLFAGWLGFFGVNPWNWTLEVRKVWQGRGILMKEERGPCHEESEDFQFRVQAPVG